MKKFLLVIFVILLLPIFSCSTGINSLGQQLVEGGGFSFQVDGAEDNETINVESGSSFDFTILDPNGQPLPYDMDCYIVDEDDEQDLGVGTVVCNSGSGTLTVYADPTTCLFRIKVVLNTTPQLVGYLEVQISDCGVDENSCGEVMVTSCFDIDDEAQCNSAFTAAYIIDYENEYHNCYWGKDDGITGCYVHGNPGENICEAGDLVHTLGRDQGPSADKGVFTIPDLTSSETQFNLYVDFRESVSDGEDISTVNFRVGAKNDELSCDDGAGCHRFAAGLCDGQSDCNHNITGQDVANYLDYFGLREGFNSGECVEIYITWELSDRDPDYNDGLTHAESAPMVLSLQNETGVCSGAGAGDPVEEDTMGVVFDVGINASDQVVFVSHARDGDLKAYLGTLTFDENDPITWSDPYVHSEWATGTVCGDGTCGQPIRVVTKEGPDNYWYVLLVVDEVFGVQAAQMYIYRFQIVAGTISWDSAIDRVNAVGADVWWADMAIGSNYAHVIWSPGPGVDAEFFNIYYDRCSFDLSCGADVAIDSVPDSSSHTGPGIAIAANRFDIYLGFNDGGSFRTYYSDDEGASFSSFGVATNISDYESMFAMDMTSSRVDLVALTYPTESTLRLKHSGNLVSDPSWNGVDTMLGADVYNEGVKYSLSIARSDTTLGIVTEYNARAGYDSDIVYYSCEWTDLGTRAPDSCDGPNYITVDADVAYSSPHIIADSIGIFYIVYAGGVDGITVRSVGLGGEAEVWVEP